MLDSDVEVVGVVECVDGTDLMVDEESDLIEVDELLVIVDADSE